MRRQTLIASQWYRSHFPTGGREWLNCTLWSLESVTRLLIGKEEVELPFQMKEIQEHTLGCYVCFRVFLLSHLCTPEDDEYREQTWLCPLAVETYSSRSKRSLCVPVSDLMSTGLWKHAKGNVTLECNVSFLFYVLHDCYHNTDVVIYRNSPGNWVPSAWWLLSWTGK